MESIETMRNNPLTLPVPFISESYIEMKIKLNFYFRTSLWCLKMFNVLSHRKEV